MVDPRKLCDQHLLGEHNELHALVGTVEKHDNGEEIVRSLCEDGYLDLTSVQSRHHKVAREMRRRGMNHDSSIYFRNPFDFEGGVDVDESLEELKSRCPDCKQRILDRP